MSKLLGFLLILIVGASAVVAWQNSQLGPTTSQPIWENTSVQDLMLPLSELREEITPAPLRSSLGGPQGKLTIAGVLSETNHHRAEAGVAPLTGDATLNTAAANKLADLFALQYFAHDSPDGRGPSDVVDNVGYQYIRVGENLALGNFADDATLVQAWMDSPGHRASILKEGFDEIGIAVGSGTFDGRETWIAVQTFTKPLSACPNIDTNLQSKFEVALAAYEDDNDQLNARRAEIDREQAAVEDLLTALNKLIDDGNEQIAQGNTVAAETGNNEEAQPFWDAGASLHEQAEEKRGELATRDEALDQQASNHNKDIDSQEQVNQDLDALSETINQQVRAYNECLE